MSALTAALSDAASVVVLLTLALFLLGGRFKAWRRWLDR